MSKSLFSPPPFAIRVRQLGKAYEVWSNPSARLKGAIAYFGHYLACNWLGSGHRITTQLNELSRQGRREVHALRNVSFEVRKGEVVGVIGYNGSGKSTLLQILAGTLTPSSGGVEVQGRVAALLELGSGINPEFTGRENIFIYGSILGFPPEALQKRMFAIEEFAEIGEFIDQPVKTYSTGMVARLAFAVLTQLDPDILIVDEALSVGDAYFQHKSINLIRRFQKEGKTMLVVSHDVGTIKTMCTRAIILERGLVVREGDAATVCDYYNALVAKKEKDHEISQIEREKGRVVTRSGDQQASIADVHLINHAGENARVFTVGELAMLRCALEFRAEVNEPTVGISIRDRLGNNVFGSNTFYHQRSLGTFAAGNFCEVTFALHLNLAPGRYSVTVAIHSGRDHLNDNYDWQDNVVVFEVLPGSEPTFTGSAALPLQIEIHRGRTVAHHPYEWGKRIEFIQYGDSTRYAQAGWDTPEPNFTWTDGQEATLRFELTKSSCARALRIRASGFTTESIRRQRVTVLFDDQQIAIWEIDLVNDHMAHIPIALIETPGRHVIRLLLPDATPPASSGASSDTRRLGICVFAATID